MTYTQTTNRDQVPSLHVENLSLEDEIVASAFWRLRDPEPFGDVQARHAIIFGYENGYWGATEAFNALKERDLFGDVEAFMETFCAGVEALASRMPLPPTDIPSPAPGVRCAPSDELLEAVVGRRVA